MNPRKHAFQHRNRICTNYNQIPAASCKYCCTAQRDRTLQWVETKILRSKADPSQGIVTVHLQCTLIRQNAGLSLQSYICFHKREAGNLFPYGIYYFENTLCFKENTSAGWTQPRASQSLEPPPNPQDIRQLLNSIQLFPLDLLFSFSKRAGVLIPIKCYNL